MFTLNPIMLSLLGGISLALVFLPVHATVYDKIDLTQGPSGGPATIGPGDQVLFKGTNTGGAVTLGNGHSFTSNNASIYADGQLVYAINTNGNDATVELNNSDINVTQSNGASWQAAIQLSGSRNKLTMNNSTVHSNSRQAPVLGLGNNSTANITGGSLHGEGLYLLVQGTDSQLNLQDTVLTHRNAIMSLLSLDENNSSTWKNVQVNASGSIGNVSKNSTLNIENSNLRSYGQAFWASEGGSLNIKDSEIHIGLEELAINNSELAEAGFSTQSGYIQVSDSKVFFTGKNGSHIFKQDQAGGQLDLNNVSITDRGATDGNVANGFWLVDDVTATLTDVNMEVGNTGIDIRQGLAILERVNITTSKNGNSAHGIYVQGHPAWSGSPGVGRAALEGTDLNIHTHANGAAGIFVITYHESGLDASANTKNVNIQTEGTNAHGVYMFNGTTTNTSSLAMTGTTRITTQGDGAVGIYLLENPVFNVEQLEIATAGANADGIRFRNATNNGAQISQTLNSASIYSSQASALRASNSGVAFTINDSNIQGRQLFTIDGDQASLSSSSLTSQGSQLVGDLQLRDGARLDALNLLDNSHWTGGIDKDESSNVQTVSLLDNSTWLMTRSSEVHTVSNKEGHLLFQTGPEGHFKTLHVNEYEGGGHISMNVHLGDDSSDSDKLFIADNGKITGTTELQILNANGQGGQTVNGIPLVLSGTGAIIADDAFTLSAHSSGYRPSSNTLSANGYEYSLVSKDKEGGQNHEWYLTSTPLPPDLKEPTEPETPNNDSHTNLSPEAPAYLAAHRAAQNLFAHSFHERELNQQGLSKGQRKVWGRTQVRTDRNMGFEGHDSVSAKVNSSMIQFGGDILKKGFGTGELRAGLMAGVGEISAKSRNQFIDPADLSHRSTLHAKDKRTGYNAGVYATYLENAQTREGWFIDSSLQFTHYRGKLNSDLGEFKHNNNLWQIAAETGYGWKHSPDSAVLITPKAQLLYSHLSGDDGEVKGTSYSAQRQGTTQSRIGVRIEAAPDTSTLALRPFMELAWIHRFNDTGVIVGDSRFKASNARNAGEIQLGVDGEISKSTLLSARFIREQGSGSSYGMSGMVNLNYRW